MFRIGSAGRRVRCNNACQAMRATRYALTFLDADPDVELFEVSVYRVALCWHSP